MKTSLTLATFVSALAFTGLVAAEEPASLSSILPKTLHDASGKEVDPATLKGKHVALYFSAHWCPPCRAFTPSLVKFRDANAAEGFEIVFVSLDSSDGEKETYIKEMDMKWLSIPGASSPEAQALAQRFQVQGIPSLIVLSPDGTVVTENGREDVMTSPETALSKWKGTKTS